MPGKEKCSVTAIFEASKVLGVEHETTSLDGNEQALPQTYQLTFPESFHAALPLQEAAQHQREHAFAIEKRADRHRVAQNARRFGGPADPYPPHRRIGAEQDGSHQLQLRHISRCRRVGGWVTYLTLEGSTHSSKHHIM